MMGSKALEFALYHSVNQDSVQSELLSFHPLQHQWDQ